MLRRVSFGGISRGKSPARELCPSPLHTRTRRSPKSSPSHGDLKRQLPSNTEMPLQESWPLSRDARIDHGSRHPLAKSEDLGASRHRDRTGLRVGLRSSRHTLTSSPLLTSSPSTGGPIQYPEAGVDRHARKSCTPDQVHSRADGGLAIREIIHAKALRLDCFAPHWIWHPVEPIGSLNAVAVSRNAQVF